MSLRLDEVVVSERQPGVHIPEEDAWKVEYVRKLLQVQKLEKEATTSLPSLDILFGAEGDSFRKLERSSQYSTKLRKGLVEFEKKHADVLGLESDGTPARWKPEDSVFREAYGLLRLYEVEKLQRQIETQVHELSYLASCANKLGDRPGDLKRARKEIERGRNRVRVALSRLNQWRTDLAESVVFRSGYEERASSSEAGAQEAGTDCVGWGIEPILKGEFPWLEEHAGISSTQVSAGIRLKRKLTSSQEGRSRGEEEKALVEAEMQRTLTRYREQINGLDLRLGELQVELEQGGVSSDYILGARALLSATQRRLQNLLRRAEVLFIRSLQNPLNLEDMCSAIGARQTRSPPSDPIEEVDNFSDDEAGMDPDGESEDDQ